MVVCFLFFGKSSTDRGRHEDNNKGADCTANHKKSPPI
ncbi:hypothetical protein M917_2099 [Psychrobacter aquaticus CMS 56]|uniref:Uncharacterized protein n=1 Tax=Psychrobacter aquaticus CMS 56 TaxID=1354303 RepID=U4T8F4_9GAMM|nr:hypothetical protein M917_2099 [Psychrobacter aquaticus CMS 56]